MGKRIDYIDVIKGFSILWIVLWHSYYYLLTSQGFLEVDKYNKTGIFVDFRMPLFFFLSGIFFRQRKFTEFFTKRLQTLIVPFITFYVIGVLWSVVQYILLVPLLNLNIHSIIGLFREYAIALICLYRLHPPLIPTIVNGPLWFLVALFLMQMIHYCAVKLINKKWLLLFFAIVFYGISLILKEHNVTGLFYMAAIGQFYIFYLLGSLTGPQLLKLIENKIYAQRIVMIALPVLILLFLLQIPDGIIGHLKFILSVLSFIALVFVFFRYTKNFMPVKFLRFWGRHSLEVLVTHLLIMSLVIGVIPKIFQEIFFLNPGSHLWLYVISIFLITVLIEIPVIKFCDRYMYLFLGKQRISNEWANITSPHTPEQLLSPAE